MRAAGVAVEVVPGVTAACAAAASLQIPLTHRDVARSLHFVTGHGSAGEVPAHDWGALAACGGTIAAYMASKTLRSVAACLMEAGWWVRRRRWRWRMPRVRTNGICTARWRAGGPAGCEPAGGPTLVLIGAVVALSRALQEAARLAA